MVFDDPTLEIDTDIMGILVNSEDPTDELLQILMWQRRQIAALNRNNRRLVSQVCRARSGAAAVVDEMLSDKYAL